MSISGDLTEIQTVTLSEAGDQDVAPDPQFEAIDAEEDRIIVGWQWDFAGITTPMGSVHSRAHAYTGANPTQEGGIDHGGKFFIGAFYFVMTDQAGFGASGVNMPAVLVEDPAHGWDWNEDVTLTLEVVVQPGTDMPGGFELFVYYIER